MEQPRHPFTSISQSVVLRAALVLLSSVVLVSFFLPWLQMEVVPVDGRHLPQLAAEYYGKGHWMVWFTYLVFLIPAYAIMLIWRMVYNLTPGAVHYALVALLLSVAMGGTLLYFDVTDAMNLTIRYGYLLELAGTGGMALLVWRWPPVTSAHESAAYTQSEHSHQ